MCDVCKHRIVFVESCIYTHCLPASPPPCPAQLDHDLCSFLSKYLRDEVAIVPSLDHPGKRLVELRPLPAAAARGTPAVPLQPPFRGPCHAFLGGGRKQCPRGDACEFSHAPARELQDPTQYHAPARREQGGGGGGVKGKR